MEIVPIEEERPKRGWLLAGVFLAFALALFWSVDSSIRYILIGLAGFCFFQYLRNNWIRKNSDGPSAEVYEHPTTSSIFLEDVKEFFTKRPDQVTPENRTRQGRAFVLMVLGFISSIFFIIIVIIIFSDGASPEVYNENYLKATEYFNNQQYDSANYYYRLAQVGDPDNPVLYLERGNTFFNLRQNDSALIMYTRAVELNPEYAEAQYNIGLILYNQKSYRQARDETRKILKYSPESIGARLLIGDCYYSQSQLDSAMTWYEPAYAGGYRSAGLCHVMAYIYDTKGQTEKAIGLYKETLGQDSTRTEVYTRLGELLPGQEGQWYRNKAAGATSSDR